MWDIIFSNFIPMKISSIPIFFKIIFVKVLFVSNLCCNFALATPLKGMPEEMDVALIKKSSLKRFP